jgi:thiamine biosynthesis lipoprotein
MTGERPSEQERRLELFGSEVRLLVGVPRFGLMRSPGAALLSCEEKLRRLHSGLTRFDPASALCALNSDPEPEVRAPPDVCALVEAAARAAELTAGLVDATVFDALPRHGYRDSMVGREPADLATALTAAPSRREASAREPSPWLSIAVDRQAMIVTRPPGVSIDSGGIAKGMAADLCAEELAGYSSYAVDCGGDLRIGGADGLERRVEITDPFTGAVTATFGLAAGAVATSGLGRRLWPHGSGFAHHVIDPGTGAPAWTGLLQATAVAPTALEAEALAKAALLSGPDGAARWLERWGGVTFADDSRRSEFGPLRTNLDEAIAA